MKSETFCQRISFLTYLCQPTSARSPGSSPTFCSQTAASWSRAPTLLPTSRCSAAAARCSPRAPSSSCLGLTDPARPQPPTWPASFPQQVGRSSIAPSCPRLRCQSWTSGQREDLKLMLANCGRDLLEDIAVAEDGVASAPCSRRLSRRSAPCTLAAPSANHCRGHCCSEAKRR